MVCGQHCNGGHVIGINFYKTNSYKTISYKTNSYTLNSEWWACRKDPNSHQWTGNAGMSCNQRLMGRQKRKCGSNNWCFTPTPNQFLQIPFPTKPIPTNSILNGGHARRKTPRHHNRQGTMGQAATSGSWGDNSRSTHPTVDVTPSTPNPFLQNSFPTKPIHTNSILNGGHVGRTRSQWHTWWEK
jgi:hypothetical protein